MVMADTMTKVENSSNLFQALHPEEPRSGQRLVKYVALYAVPSHVLPRNPRSNTEQARHASPMHERQHVACDLPDAAAHYSLL